MVNPKRRKLKVETCTPESSNEETLDNLALYEQWAREILPELRELLIKGKVTAKEISKKFESYAAARAVTIAITETDSTKALAAIKDIQDRASGKPTEHKKLQHEFQELPDEELDALLMSEAEDLVESDDKETNESIQ